jgi:hypothetical protein
MFRWLIRLIAGPEHPLRRRVMACEDSLVALEARIDQRYDELRVLRGVVSRMKHQEKAAQEADDDPIPPEAGLPAHPATVPSTAHLARRFKVF